jgi:uncharacterized membrane protein
MSIGHQSRWLRWGSATLWWLLVTAAALALAWMLYERLYLVRPQVLVVTWEGTEVTFLEPRAFWFVLAAPLMMAAAWFGLTDFHLIQRALNLGLRLLLLASLTIAMARPSLTDREARVCTVYLVDVSDSIPDDVLPRARDIVQQTWAARGTGLMRLVTFAARPRVMPLAPGMEQVPPITRHEGEGAGTESNPAAALRMSYGLCPPDHLARAVLITDGNQNRGDLLAEAADADRFGMRLHVHELPFEPPAEVLVRDLQFPSDIQLSEPFRMTAEIFSNRDCEVLISLRQNEFRDIQGRRFNLTAGINRIELTAEVYEAGYREFVLDVRPDGPDRFAANNSFTRAVTVLGRPRVLYVEGESRSRLYLERALDRERNDLANFDLEVRGAFGFPATLDEMRNFDLIILSDVEASNISRAAMANIQRYVRELGGGFLMVGGEDSFGPGGYDNTPLEELSPVLFDMQRQRDLPSLAILLVIDRSGSMDGLKLEMAKDAARAVVDLLGPQDMVGVIAFDDIPNVVVDIQSAANRSRIRSDIGRIGPGGGTDIYPALVEAYAQMLDTPARIKHVIVLTDGQAPWNGISEITSNLRSDGVTVSSVAVGREADRSLLEMVADLGGGRFYATNDPNNIPQIFVQETSQVARTNLIEEPFRPVPRRRSQTTAGIDWTSVPYLLGYVQTRARPSAEVLLETESGEPLLARWRQGLGRVAVFTSDIKNRWSVEWVRSRVYPQFWAQVVRDMMRVRTEDALAMNVEVRNGEAHLSVDAIDSADRFINGLTSVAEVTSPGGETRTVELLQTAAGRYEATLPLTEFGPWQIQAEHSRDGDTVAISNASLTYPYPDELQVVEPRPELGRRAVELARGSINPAPEALWDPGDDLAEFQRELWPMVLFIALALLIVDLLTRRVRLFGLRPIQWDRVTGQ